MNRARAALLLALAVPLVAFAAPSAVAGQGRGPLATSHRQVVVLIEDRVSFEQLMRAQPFRELARAGGVALMTTRTGAGDRTRASYLTIENGALSDARSRESTLTTALRRAGISTCLATAPPLPETLADPRRLLALPCPRNYPVLFANIGVGPRAELPGLDGVTIIDDGDSLRIDEDIRLGRPGREEAEIESVAARDAQTLLDAVPFSRSPTLVMVVAPSTSLAMDRRGDQVTPFVMAEARHGQLVGGGPAMHALTSPTTRTDGVVANVDVAPTILRWLGVPVPSSMDGEPITFTDAPAPFALHRLHLEQRRTRLPVALGIVAFIAAVGMAGIAVLLAMAMRGDVVPRVRAVMRFLTLAGTAILLVILGGGLLPRMTYAWVVPYLVITTAALAWLAGRSTGGRFAPFVFLGVTGLLFVVIDALFGGNAFRVPLYGNTIFDGARFYGISNTFIMLVVASALFVAVAMERRLGAMLIFAAGLFMGFPRLGINIGGSIALFAAAGIWWAITAGRPRDARSVVWGAAVTALVAAVGLAIVLLANRYLPGAPTHATRFVERASGGAGYGVHTLARRLTVGVSQFGHVPAAWIPIVGLPVVLALVLWGAGPIGRACAAAPRWRDATVTLILTAVVAYIANDTGVAAAGPGFLYAMAMLVYAALEWGPRAPSSDRISLPAREVIST